MFEAAEIGNTLPKGEYKRIAPQLRADLLDIQYELSRNGRFPVVILISGVRGAGKGETVNLLNEWMDPRHIVTHAFGEKSDEEGERPHMWRFWRALPPKGHIGVLFGSWYTDPIVSRVLKKTKSTGLAQAIEEIRHFSDYRDGGDLRERSLQGGISVSRLRFPHEITAALRAAGRAGFGRRPPDHQLQPRLEIREGRPGRRRGARLR